MPIVKGAAYYTLERSHTLLTLPGTEGGGLGSKGQWERQLGQASVSARPVGKSSLKTSTFAP